MLISRCNTEVMVQKHRLQQVHTLERDLARRRIIQTSGLFRHLKH